MDSASTVVSDWQDVGAALDDATSLVAWLESKGLGKYVEKIIDISDAEHVDDLKLLDPAMVEDMIKAADIKMVAAQKLRLAIAELRDTAAPTKSLQVASSVVAADSSVGAPLACRSPDAQECVAICIDRSGSMGTPFAEVTVNVIQGATKQSVAQRTRMEAVKAMFYAFRDRVESMGVGAYELGLLQFDDRVEQLMDVSSSLNLFETIVDDMEKRGMTAIYSSIVEAAEMLKRRYSRDSKTDLRILVLTDGQNNTGASPEQALDAANEINATVDAIIVGDSPDANLRRIVAATEGECYQIGSLGEGFELLEAESVVSLKARRGGIEKPAFKPRPRVELSRVSEKTITQGTAVQRAPVLAPDLANQKVVDVKKMGELSVVATSASVKRILAEIKKVSTGECPATSGKGIHVFPAPDNLHFWRALIEGPSDSPFAGGVFALNVLLPSDYPLSAPKITFETPIYHCNVSDSGKICLKMLQEGWNPALSIVKCLESIQDMMLCPDTDDALRQWIADLTITHFKYVNTSAPDSRYFDNGQAHTKQYASTTLEEWRQKWSC